MNFAARDKVALVAVVLLAGLTARGTFGQRTDTSKREENQPPVASPLDEIAIASAAKVKKSEKLAGQQIPAPDGLCVTIWPRKTQVKLGERFDVLLRVVNASERPQIFEVWSCSWFQHWQCSNSCLAQERWACKGNAAKVIHLQPGEAHERTLKVYVRDPGASKIVAFRMGFTSLGSKRTFWSNEVVLGLKQKDPSSGFEVVAPLRRSGPQLTIRVTEQHAKSNWHYDLHITTTDGVDQHLELRNGQPVKREDLRLADVTADGFLDILIVGGKDERGQDWFKTWLYDPARKEFRWINGR